MVKKILYSLFLLSVFCSCSNNLKPENELGGKTSLDSKYKTNHEDVDENGINISDLKGEEKTIYDLLYKNGHRLSEADGFSYRFKSENRLIAPDDGDKSSDLTSTSTTSEGQVFQDKKGNIKAIVKSSFHLYGEKSTNVMTLYSLKNGGKYDNYQFRNNKWRYIKANDEALFSNLTENFSKYYKNFSFAGELKDMESSKYTILQAEFTGKEVRDLKGAKDINFSKEGLKADDISYHYSLFFDQKDELIKIIIDSSESYANDISEDTKDRTKPISEPPIYKKTICIENIEVNQVEEIILPREAEGAKNY